MDESEITKPQPPDGEGPGHESGGGEAGEPYEYTPLPEPGPAGPGQSPLLVPTTLWTRLITIHPGEYDDDIAVDLSDIAMEETDESQLRGEDMVSPKYRVSAAPHLEQYEPLSYVWGSPESPSHVIIGEEGRIIPITRNLEVAMRHLRYPDRPRVVWIDALCIDQTSLSDKSRQVGHMNHIYWSTPRVVVWLGPEADDSARAMDILESVGKKIQVDWGTLGYSCVTEEDEEVWGRKRTLPLDERDRAAIWSLIKRPWFERIWIRQEVIMAGDDAAVYCGRSCISLDLFRRGLFRVTRGNYSTEAIMANIVLRPRGYRLENLRFKIRGAKCTDPKDYVYGTLGLIDETRDLAITPDYSKSLAEIYQEVVLTHIDVYGTLELLDTCGNDPADCEHSSSPGNIKLPSWVPNWTSGTDPPFHLSVFRRFVPLAARAEYLGDGILRVAGLMKGVIQDFIGLDTTTQLGFSASLRGIVPKDAADSQYPGGGSLWDAYRIALCGNCFMDRKVPADATCFLNYEDSHAALEGIIHGGEQPPSLGSAPAWPNDSPEYAFYYTAESLKERFFITEDGLMGWAPKQARQGDHIAIMLGSETPTVLRPVSSAATEQYEVVGSCYLQGFMFGEGFLGPLPEGMRPVLYQKDKNGTPAHFEFLDTISGESFPQDPRWGASLEPDQARAWQIDEMVCYRVEVEGLRSIGLDIQYFDLV